MPKSILTDSSPFTKTSERAYHIIYSKILDGSLPPGSKLSLRKMATLAGVSVTPMVEALNLLVEDGLVETRPQWGYFVAIPTQSQARNQLMLREAIECQVARVLCESMTDSLRQQLLTRARHHDQMIRDFLTSKKYTPREIDAEHYKLHMFMAQSTGYELLAETLRRINLFFLLLKADPIEQINRLPDNWHEQLALAICSGDTSTAEQKMREHVRDSYQAILRHLPSASELIA